MRYESHYYAEARCGVSVQWSPVSESWEYTCLLGCHGFDYESEAEALDAFLNHDCDGEAA